MCGLFYYLEHNIMPVPTSIADLSKNAADNSPKGTESAKGTIDDYFRAHAAFIRQLFDQLLGPSVNLQSAGVVSIGFASALNITISGNVAIQTFDDATEGTLRWIVFNGAMTLVHNPSAIVLPGAANLTTAFGDSALFKCTGGSRWICLHYMRASGAGPVAASMQTDGYLSVGDWNSFNSRMTPAAVAAAYLSLANGGVMQNHIDFINGRGIFMRDSKGNPRQLVKMDDDVVNFTVAGGTGINYYNQAGNTVVASLSNAGAFTATTVTETSDGRLKKLWRRFGPDLLQNVAALKKVGTFVWRKGAAAGTMGMGGCAQEIEELMPWAVVTDANGFKSVRYGASAFVIVVELTRAFFAHVAKTEKRLTKLEGK